MGKIDERWYGSIAIVIAILFVMGLIKCKQWSDSIPDPETKFNALVQKKGIQEKSYNVVSLRLISDGDTAINGNVSGGGITILGIGGGSVHGTVNSTHKMQMLYCISAEYNGKIETILLPVNSVDVMVSEDKNIFKVATDFTNYPNVTSKYFLYISREEFKNMRG
jgi:hypothetical protein